MADIETPRWRCKEKIGNIVNRLIQHANGEIEMTSTQLKAAELYLRKTLPDLNKTMHADANGNKLSFSELLGALDGRSAGLPKAERETE